jgi:hypothetical protein
MDLNKQITKVAEIKQVVESLQASYDLLKSALNSLTVMRVKLTVDFSPGCAECGQFAGFIKDCRDNLLIQQIKTLIGFMDCITRLQYVINPENNTLNSDYAKQMAIATQQQNLQQND